MGKKQRGPDLNRVLTDEANAAENPFSKVVLKEKKEVKKEIRSGKKPGEIVHGYNPSLSFADILSSYEKTGDPYRMPKKTASSSSSFGDILDEWESGRNGTKKKKEIKREENRSSYKATRSFESILDEYEGIYREKESKKESRKNNSDASSSVDNLLRGSTLLTEESDDTPVPDSVSWSVIGGASRNYVRVKEGEKKSSSKRISSYTPSSSFGTLLDEYERKKTGIKKKENPEVAPGTSRVEEHTFFIESEDDVVPDTVSWSVLGGANKNFVRKEENAEETEKEEKNETREIKRTTQAYVPTKSFEEILISYSEKKTVSDTPSGAVTTLKEDIVSPPSDPFFIRREDDVVPDTVSWSVLGGANKNYVRPVETKKKEERTEKEEKKETLKEKTRATEPYSPTTSFSEILTAYEEKKIGKTFSQIVEEKGDSRKKKTPLTINELRRMGVQATLDLHGETQKESGELISAFLDESVEHGLRKVSVITGKGLHSDSGSSVLRSLALSLLSSSPHVQEVSPAPLQRGGSGALWIILKEKSE